MKKSRTYQLLLFLSLLLISLLQGCGDTYAEFSSQIITSAFLAFFLGIGTIWGTHKLLNIEKVRGLLTSLSPATKLFSFILGIFSVSLVIIGFISNGLHFYNTFLGVVLLFISNRLYQSSKCWKEENWEDAKLNSKLIMFSIGIFVAIMFLIYFGKNLLGF